MNAGILKIGTMPLNNYYIRTNKRLADYAPGDNISFREQGHGAKWEHGIIREIMVDVPRIERM